MPPRPCEANPMDLGGLITTIGYIIVAVLVVGVGYGLGSIPGAIAKSRGHPNAPAIRLCGLLGLLVWPAWVVAFIWAYTNARPTERPSIPRPVTLTAPPPGSDEWGDLPGTFEVLGVDRDTELDSRMRIDADSPDNARVKAELRGMVVTKVRRID